MQRKNCPGKACEKCEKEESYIVLLRDIEYVKTGYVGSPLLYYAGIVLFLVGFLVMAIAPALISRMAASSRMGGKVGSLNNYGDQQQVLWTNFAVCEGGALLLWTWYLWRKRSVIHLGVRPTGGEHGKINPYGSASPFFIIFKTLQNQPDDEIMQCVCATICLYIFLNFRDICSDGSLFEMQAHHGTERCSCRSGGHEDR